MCRCDFGYYEAGTAQCARCSLPFCLGCSSATECSACGPEFSLADTSTPSTRSAECRLSDLSNFTLSVVRQSLNEKTFVLELPRSPPLAFVETSRPFRLFVENKELSYTIVSQTANRIEFTFTGTESFTSVRTVLNPNTLSLNNALIPFEIEVSPAQTAGEYYS